MDDLTAKTRLAKDVLSWHLAVLENGRCIEKESKQGILFFKITQFGEIVDYLK